MKRKYRKKRPNLALLAVVAAMLPAGFLLTSNRGEGAATDTAASVELAPPEGGRVAVALGAEALVQVEVEEQDDARRRVPRRVENGGDGGLQPP